MTITIDKATLARIREIAGSRGVSKFIAEAARERAGRNELLDYLAELDEKYGPVPPEMYAETDRDMRKIFGMPPPTKPWDGSIAGYRPSPRARRAAKPGSAKPRSASRRQSKASRR